jgi:cysteinyl-tRNA synthetase
VEQLPQIKVHNTLTGRKEEFRPIEPPRVRMYVCGITPYSTSHFGHGMSAVVFDTIRRYLMFRGYDVRYVQNFTDIEDKIIARSNELGVDWRRLVEKHTAEYFEALQALNVLPAYAYPRASGEIDGIVEMVEGLIERGAAYRVDGDVYFRVAMDEDYGKLSHRNLDDLIAGARVEVDERKESPADFALWKAAKPGEPWWDSPFSKGRPGWHIECSVMSSRYLGEQIDIHGGGQDLIFPHHENEIAQSESYSDREPFVRYWLHNGFVMFGDTKMSKSLGNTVLLPDALAEREPVAVRLFILQSHYRSPLSLSDDGVRGGRAGGRAAAQRARGGRRRGVGRALAGGRARPRGVHAGDGRRLQHTRRDGGDLRPRPRGEPAARGRRARAGRLGARDAARADRRARPQARPRARRRVGPRGGAVRRAAAADAPRPAGREAVPARRCDTRPAGRARRRDRGPAGGERVATRLSRRGCAGAPPAR